MRNTHKAIGRAIARADILDISTQVAIEHPGCAVTDSDISAMQRAAEVIRELIAIVEELEDERGGS